MKFYDAYKAQYYSQRITKKSRKHMMKYLKFLRTDPLSKCWMRDAVKDIMSETQISGD